MQDSEIRLELELELELDRASVYPILDDPVRRLVGVVVVRYPGSFGYEQQQEEGDCCDVLDLGGFGSARGCLLLRTFRDQGSRR